MKSGADAFRLGARLGAPIALSFFAFGLAFGVAAADRGLSPPLSSLTSALVFSGSSQFMILDLIGHAGALWTIVISVFLLNIRYVVMGTALLAAAPGAPRWLRLAGLLLMIDETWAVAMSPAAASDRLRVILGCGLVALIGWTCGTALGAALGRRLDEVGRLGIDFVYFSVFIFILVSMAREKLDLLPWMTAAAVALLAHAALPGKWYVVIGGLAGATVGGCLSWRTSRPS
jgi:predicted branched-subunit amino acid permease